MTATWSLNEIEALALKAARGAGFEWGLAEEAGQAVRWLLARDLPGADALLAICVAGSSKTPEFCPLTFGCALCDGLVSVSNATSRKVVAPLLVLPFLAWTAKREKTSLSLEWKGAAFVVTADGTLMGSADNPIIKHATVTVGLVENCDLSPSKIGHRALVDCETYVALSDLAARTYAPATAASRESGAGAGLTDND